MARYPATHPLIVVLTTCPTKAVARRIAKELVSRRLAACVNILTHVESLFMWEGKLEKAKETLLVIKTVASRFEALRKEIIARHPYKVPEVIALPLTAGYQPYLEWVRASLS